MNEPNYAKCNPTTINRYLEHYGMVGHDANRDLKTAVGALAFGMLKGLKGRPVAECDNCGAHSDPELSECPYCGSTDEEPEPEVVETVGEDATDKKEQAMETKARKGKKTGKKKAASKKAGATATKKKTSGHSKKRTKKTGKKAPKAPKAPKPAKIDVHSKDLKLSKQLSTSIKKVQQLKVRGMETMWEMGKELFVIYSGKLWTQKTSTEGAAVYDSFKAFVTHEFGFTAVHAYRLMDVSTHFSKKQVQSIGVTKLHVLVRVPEEQREKLLEQAPNTSRSKLSKEIAELAAGKPPRTPRSDGFKGGAGASAKGVAAKREKAAERRAQTQRSEKLTIVRTDARVQVELFRRNSTERATTIKDAVGVEQCANGVVQYYSILETAKGLMISIETRREG